VKEIELDPRDPLGVLNRGRAYEALGKKAEAVRDLETYLERNPGAIDTRIRAGRDQEPPPFALIQALSARREYALPGSCMTGRAGETLGDFARRAARRRARLVLESELLRRTTLGLAFAVLVLLATLAALVVTGTEAPLGDELRLAALALAAAAVAASASLAVARTLAGWPSPLAAVLEVERALGTGGRLAAAVELEGRSGPFARLAVQDARAEAGKVDLARALPRRAPSETPAAPVLGVAALALALALATRATPAPAPPFGPAAREAQPAANRPRVKEAARLLATRARSLAAQEGGRDAALELARTALELEAGSTEPAALARMARARGKLEAARSPGLGDALGNAATSLAESPALRDLARALSRGDRAAIEEKAGMLAERLRESALDEEASARSRSAAARGAQALAGTPGANEARAKLDALANAPDGGPRAQAATEAGDALAKAAEQARRDEALADAGRALDEARGAATGTRPPKEDAPRAEGGTSPGDRKGKDVPGGGNARTGEKREAPNREAGGDGPHVAGKGGTNDVEKGASRIEQAPASGSHTAALRGLVGERGASAVLAAEGYAEGASSNEHRAVLQEYKRTEEEALDREPLPLDRRRLVKRYFEALEDR
jgi:hypothetical protein